MASGCGQDSLAESESWAHAEEAIGNGEIAHPFASGTTSGEAKAVLDLGNCTATLIARDWVLTAAACNPSVGGKVTGRRPGTSIERHIDEVWFHPDTDAALLHLDAPITDVSPTPLYSGTMASLKDQSLTCYGYGQRAATGYCDESRPCPSGQWCGHGNWCLTPSTDLRFANGFRVDNTAIQMAPGQGRYYFGFPRDWGMLLPGDSGGPCFLNGKQVGFATNSWLSHSTGIPAGSGGASFDLGTGYDHAAGGKSSRSAVGYNHAVGIPAILEWIRATTHWVDATNTLPNYSIPTGRISDTGNCYSCTANAEGGGALNEHAGNLCYYNDRWSCFVSNGSAEQRYENYRVLTGDEQATYWSATTSASEPPRDAVHAGWITDSGNCFVCRADHLGNKHAGKLCKYDNRWSCLIGNGGVAQRFESYEVMHDRSRVWHNKPLFDWNHWDPANTGAIAAGQISDSGTCYACSVDIAQGRTTNTHGGKLCNYNDRWSCFIGNGGAAQRFEDYKVLMGASATQNTYSWTNMSSTQAVPANAVWSGKIQGSDCYVCRGNDHGNTHIGKLCAYDNQWICSAANGSIEQPFTQFEVMLNP